LCGPCPVGAADCRAAARRWPASSAGNSYVTGGFEDTASFGATTLTSQRFTDIFVWRVTKQSK
jgi:hypothetical protein